MAFFQNIVNDVDWTKTNAVNWMQPDCFPRKIKKDKKGEYEVEKKNKRIRMSEKEKLRQEVLERRKKN